MRRKAIRTSKSSRTKRTGKSPSRPSARSRSSGLDHIAQALGISLDPSWREAIAINLRLILHHAKLVDEFPLADDFKPAPVFYA